MDFPYLPLYIYFESISGTARTSNSVSFSRSTICMISSWYACRNFPGGSRISMSHSFLVSMVGVMSTNLVVTVGDDADPSIACS